MEQVFDFSIQHIFNGRICRYVSNITSIGDQKSISRSLFLLHASIDAHLDLTTYHSHISCMLLSIAQRFHI